MNTRSWLALLVISALIGWFALPSPPSSAALVAPRRDTWVLPPKPRRAVDNAEVVMAANAPFWGAVNQATAGAVPPPVLEDPRWRIAAVFGGPTRRGVLVTFAAEGKAAQRMFVGDRLPSGHRIVSIGERELCIRIGNKDYRMGVERIEP